MMPADARTRSGVPFRLPVLAVASISGLVWSVVGFLPWIADGLTGPLNAAPAGPGRPRQSLYTFRWTGAGLLGAGLVVIGARPATRLLGWFIAVGLAWLVTPTVTAAGYLEQLLRPATGLPETLRDSLEAAWHVFTMAAAPTNRPLTLWVTALLAAGTLALLLNKTSVFGPTRGPRTHETPVDHQDPRPRP